MPVIHDYTDGSGIYLKSNINGSFITFQATSAAKNFLTDLGYSDGNTVSWHLIKPLWEQDHIYTGGSGTTIQASDFNTDKADTSSLNTKEKQELKNFLHNGGKETETDVPVDIPQLLNILSSESGSSPDPANFLGDAYDWKGAVKSIRHFGQHHPITASDVQLSENGHPIYSFMTADVEWTAKDLRWADSWHDWTFRIRLEDTLTQLVKISSTEFDWIVENEPITTKTIRDLLVVYPDIVWLCREMPGYSVNTNSWDFQKIVDSKLPANHSYSSIVSEVSSENRFNSSPSPTRGVIVACDSEYGRLQTTDYCVLPFSLDEATAHTDKLQPGLPVSLIPRQHRGTFYAFAIDPIDLDSGHILLDGLVSDTTQNKTKNHPDKNKANSRATDGRESTTKYTVNTDFSTDPHPEAERPLTEQIEGEVIFIDNKRSYGFIKHNSISESIYLTSREIRASGATVGETVLFEIEDTHGGVRAVNVSKTDEVDESKTLDREIMGQKTGNEDTDTSPDKKDVKKKSEEIETYPDTVYNEDILRCPCCETLVTAVELLTHIQGQNDEAHGSVETIPDNIDLDSAPVVKEGHDTVIFPPRSEAAEVDDFRPLCRWCGRIFLRYGGLEIHTQSNRDSVDNSLHSDASIENSGVLAAFDADGEILATEESLSDVMTDEAVQAIDHLESEDDACLNHTDDVSEIEGENEETKYGEDSDRIPELESYWLYTDLCRLLKLIHKNMSISSDDEAILSNHLQSAIRERTRLEQLCSEISVSLQDYKSVWDEPELGQEVADEILRAIGVADSHGSLHLPLGYLLPFESLEDIQKSATANCEQTTTETANEETIPRTLVEDVLETYQTYEKDYRQGSWFHAAEILERKIENWEASDN